VIACVCEDEREDLPCVRPELQRQLVERRARVHISPVWHGGNLHRPLAHGRSMSFPSGVPPGGSAPAPTHRPWRYMLLAAMVAAVFGAFLPLIDIKYGRLTLGLTAMDLSFGMDKTRALAEKEIPKLPSVLNKRLQNTRSNQEDLKLVLDASRWAALAFVPGVLLGVLGVVGLIRRRVGRVSGVFALLLGLGSIAAWLGLRFGLAYAEQEADLGKVVVSLQVGAHLLLVVGGIAVLAGLGALFQPDQKPA